MIVSLPSRGIGAAALAAALALAACSSDSDVPKTMASAPDGGTQVNTDTGSGGTFPDVNSVPNQRPTSTIQDLNKAPEGLSAAPTGTQYGEPLVGGPTSSAQPPAPPPPPLPPIPEVQTQSSDASAAPAPAPAASEPAADASSAEASATEATEATEPMPDADDGSAASAQPIATPEVAEPQPMDAEPQPMDAQPAPAAPAAEGQTIQGQMPQTQAAQAQAAPVQPAQPAPESGVAQGAPMAAAPQPVAPVGTPQEGAQPFQPEAQLALAPGSVQTPSMGGTQQAALPSSAYGPNYAALAPESYGINFPSPALPPYEAYNPAQAMYRSPYASPPTNYGGPSVAAPTISSQSTMMAPTFASYGQMAYGGQPVGLIYFRDGSAKLSSDDRSVLKQIAQMQQAYGGVIHVVGHASMHTGTMDFTRHQQANQRISEARANAVARQLMRYGVPQAAIQTAAAGDSQPLYSEVMPSGEAANRRAEVYLGAY